MKIKKLTPQGTKILKMFHIFFVFCWIVGGLAVSLLLFLTRPESGDELYMRSLMLQIVDDYFIICGAIGASLTGLIYSIWTNWGFYKHTWITVKWVMIILQTIFGTMLGPFINDNVVIADQLRDAALTNPIFIENMRTSMLWGSIQTAFLLAVIVISVQKPWKKKK
jgi:uncharacterized membrane protein